MIYQSVSVSTWENCDIPIFVVYVETTNYPTQKYKILYHATRVFRFHITILAYASFQNSSYIIKRRLIQWNQTCDVNDYRRQIENSSVFRIFKQKLAELW